MKKIALITGITGQDGLYLAEFLLNKNYCVVGVAKNICNAKKTIPVELMCRIELVEWDMLNQIQIAKILSDTKADELYNFAAYSSGSGMYDNAVSIGDVNGLSVVRILEAIRETNINIRFCQASSREIFGEAVESPQTEQTKVSPRSPYGAAKLYADSMIKIYRDYYNLFGCSAILYNHESPRRRLEFVTRKITHQAVKIKLGLANELHLGNMDILRDWGFAGDSVRAMWLMLQHEYASDYIVATGKTHSIRDFCEYAFGYLGLDYQDYVHEDVALYRVSETSVLVGDATKLKNTLGWTPNVNFKELIKMMVDSDLHRLIKENNING